MPRSLSLVGGPLFPRHFSSGVSSSNNAPVASLFSRGKKVQTNKTRLPSQSLSTATMPSPPVTVCLVFRERLVGRAGAFSRLHQVMNTSRSPSQPFLASNHLWHSPVRLCETTRDSKRVPLKEKHWSATLPVTVAPAGKRENTTPKHLGCPCSHLLSVKGSLKVQKATSWPHSHKIASFSTVTHFGSLTTRPHRPLAVIRSPPANKLRLR